MLNTMKDDNKHFRRVAFGIVGSIGIVFLVVVAMVLYKLINNNVWWVALPVAIYLFGWFLDSYVDAPVGEDGKF